VSIAARLRLPENIPTALQISLYLYLLHVFCQGKIALAESFAGLTIVFLGWALWKRQITPGFHILYYPLAFYGIA